MCAGLIFVAFAVLAGRAGFSEIPISNGTTTDFSNLAFGNAVVALGNGQQFIRRYAFILVSALDGKLGNDFCAVFAELL